MLSFGTSDVKRDRTRKREIYGKFGVKEYWIVDGMLNQIEVYRLNGEDQELVKIYRLGEAIETPLLPDFSLKLTDIFKN